MAERKEILAAFKDAPWKSPQDIEQYVASVNQILPPELLKWLEILTARNATQDPLRHRMRVNVFGRLAEKVPHKGLFKPYVEALKHPDPLLRNTLIGLLPTVNNIAEHPDLVGQLNQQDPELRAAVTQVLKKVGGKTVFELLTKALDDLAFVGRIEAVDILIQTAGHHAIPALESVLRFGKPQEKIHTLKYLADPKFVQKDVPGALNAIALALADTNEPVLVTAVAAYSQIASEQDWFQVLEPALDAPFVKVVEAAIRGLRRFNTPRTLAALDRKLRMGPNAIRFAVLESLEVIATEDVLPLLVNALGHKQLVVRTRAGEVMARLSRTGKLDIARTVIWLLRARDENVRRMAVDLARSVKDPDGNLWPKLLASLRDEDWWVRERVVDALVEMAGKQLTRHMMAYLQDPSDVVRRYAVDVLARIKDPQSIGLLVRVASSDGDWWVRERSIEAIALLGDPRAVPYLVELLGRDDDMRFACLAALGQLRATQAGAAVAKLFSVEDSDVRMAAINCLANLGDPSHGPAVQLALTDPSPLVRAAAQQLLTHWSVAFKGGTRVEVGLSALDKLLVAVARAEADDVIIASERRPMVKKLGKMIPLTEAPLGGEQVRSIFYPHLSPHQIEELAAMREVDFSYEVKTEGLRFRANLFQQACGLSGVFRIIKGELPVFEKLGLPPVVQTFGDLKNGLVLVGGPTGAGKSTTLAALIDYVNRTSARHIISLEDPVEVVHQRKKSLVNQRELGTHTRSFGSALRATLREDPDVILVGEMRDYGTISFAVSAAETGHLVFGTVHTTSADTTVDRLINAFPGGQQSQVRGMLSESLRAVVCQYLIKRKDGQGRALAAEVMLNNDAVSALIRQNKTYQLPSIVATQREIGMQAMDNDLLRLVKEGQISAEEGFIKSRDKKLFEPLVEEEAAAKAGPAFGVPKAAPVRKAG